MEINPVSKEMKKSVKTRLLTAFVLAIISIPCVILGGWFFVAYIAACTIIMTYEFIHVLNIDIDKKSLENVQENILTGKKKKRIRFPILTYIVVYVMMISFVFWIFTDAAQEDGIVKFYDNIFQGIGMKDIRVSTLGLAFLVSMIFLQVLLSEKVDIKYACYLITMSIFISIALQSVLFLRFCPSYLYNQVINPGASITYAGFSECLLFVYCVGCALLNDVYAFFVGILFGKHKINKRISPKKTWEGFLGGIVLTTISGIIFAFIADLCHVPLLKGILDMEHWYLCVMFSLISAVVSVLGDFMFSAIKRYFNVKDFSNILPGHGGLLDRYDSVLITCLVDSVLILFIAYNPLMKLVF